MKGFKYAVLTAILVASVQCGSASEPQSAPPPEGNDPEIVSPSGRIAFVTEVSPFNGALYVANSDGSGLRQLSSGQAYYSRPRWSPDRRRIVFARTAEGSPSAIYVIDVDGKSGMVRLADGADPAWSPDGKRIVFASNGGSSGSSFGIYVMNTDGSGLRQLTSPNNPDQCSAGASANDLKPDWSPDGQKILFERQFNTAEDGGYDCGLDGYGYLPNVYVMNVDGTGVRRLRSVGPTVTDANPAWSPDGRLVAYSKQLGGIFLVDSEGSSVEQPVATQINGSALNPVWSPDGKKLLFLDVESTTSRLAIDELATGTTQLLLFSAVPGRVLGPAWSR